MIVSCQERHSRARNRVLHWSAEWPVRVGDLRSLAVTAVIQVSISHLSRLGISMIFIDLGACEISVTSIKRDLV